MNVLCCMMIKVVLLSFVLVLRSFLEGSISVTIEKKLVWSSGLIATSTTSESENHNASET